MLIQPYLNFDGRCDEAIAIYQEAIDAKLGMLMRFKENPTPDPNSNRPEVADKVMHAALRIGDTTIFASDGRCDGKSTFHGIMLSLGVSTDVEAQRYFNALADGGKITMPLGPTFFATSFGMLQDRFGVSWMVLCEKKS